MSPRAKKVLIINTTSCMPYDTPEDETNVAEEPNFVSFRTMCPIHIIVHALPSVSSENCRREYRGTGMTENKSFAHFSSIFELVKYNSCQQGSPVIGMSAVLRKTFFTGTVSWRPVIFFRKSFHRPLCCCVLVLFLCSSASVTLLVHPAHVSYDHGWICKGQSIRDTPSIDHSFLS